MIHDLILSLFHPNTEMMDTYETISNSGVCAPFLHPSEIQMLQKIVGVVDKVRKIETFVRDTKSRSIDAENDNGLYLQSFAIGVDESLAEYRKAVLETECRFLQKPHIPMSMVYVAVYPYNSLMEFLLKVIEGISSQKLTGCAILQYLHKFQFDCVPENSKAIQIIQSAIQMVFFQQLSQWLIYGRLVDKYGEFFIVCQESNLTFMDQHSKMTVGSTTTMLSREVVNFSQYELSYEHLPPFIDRSTADDILFIGQTVVKFGSHNQDSNRDHFVEENPLEFQMRASFWGDFEIKFFSYFGDLFSKAEKLNLPKFRSAIVQMKQYVTQQLYAIAKKDSDLLHQLLLIKSFFLLGRGDQFEEFFKECRGLASGNILTMNAKDLNQAFQMSAQSLNIGDDLEQFSFVVTTSNNALNEQSLDESLEQDHTLQHIVLRYKVKWPLHMIFSAEVMERYNSIFRFLLRIKKAQYDLQCVWSVHREQKLDKSNLAVQLRTKLMFFIDNMFVYLQVDVIESRFTALLAAIKSCQDFLVIQKEHSLFQIMILSHCFLLAHSTSGAEKQTEKVPENEVLCDLEKILSVVTVFGTSQLSSSESESIFNSQVPGMNSLQGLNDQFDTLVADFMIRLMRLKSGPNGMPLTQLLLRLNYNCNFTRKPRS